MKIMDKFSKKYMFVMIFFILVIIIIAVVFVFLSNDSMSTLILRVMSEKDDGRTFEVVASEGFGNEPDGWANLQINPTYSFGIRFTNISIPLGSTIIDAYVRLYSIGLPGRHNHVNCIIYGDDVDDADDFYTKGCLDRCGRIYTENYVIWDAEAPFKQWVETPSFKGIIQEIVDRPGWKKDNNLALLFITRHTDDTSVFNNFELGKPAEIYIRWRAPSDNEY